MSYDQAVLRDGPVAYWPLTGTTSERTYASVLLEYGTYQDWINSETNYGQYLGNGAGFFEDLSENNNHAAIFAGTSAGFTDTLTLNTRSFNTPNIKGCKITSSAFINIFDIYPFFKKNYESITFAAEMWLYFPNAPKSTVNIMSLDNPINYMQVYADNDFIYFTVNGVNSSYTTKKRVFSWDKKIHLMFIYSQRSIEVLVNGYSDEIIKMPDSFKLFLVDQPGPTKYSIGPQNDSDYFIINDLAFYDKKLSLQEIRNHMLYASTNANPEFFAQQGSAYHFNIKYRDDMAHTIKTFTKPEDYNQGHYSNIIPDGTGITIPQTSTAAQGSGTWYYSLPIVQPIEFAGASISWNTGSSSSSDIGKRTVKVSSSYDNGTTWYEVLNDEIIPQFLYTANNTDSPKLLVKVEINSPDTSINYQPRLDNFKIVLYKDISVAADAGGFVLVPNGSSYYMIRENQDNFISRDKNFGLYFVDQNPTNDNHPSAIITSTNSAGYKTAEFWYKYEGKPVNNATNCDVWGTSDVSITDVYIDTNANSLVNNLGSSGSLYINGVLLTNSTYTLTPEDVYFISIVYSSQRSGDIYVNGGRSGGMTGSKSVYGYITLFPGALSASDITNRYYSYFATPTGIINDGSTVLGTISEFNNTPKIGDAGQAGGIVVGVSGNTVYEVDNQDFWPKYQDYLTSGFVMATMLDIVAGHRPDLTYSFTGGYKDWRIPTKDEMQYIVDNASIVPNFLQKINNFTPEDPDNWNIWSAGEPNYMTSTNTDVFLHNDFNGIDYYEYWAYSFGGTRSFNPIDVGFYSMDNTGWTNARLIRSYTVNSDGFAVKYHTHVY